ncbi:FKBP-type peptidyl-prolyl cis-trans isomerase [Brevundimonas sp.]|uniref:FKBP-type peptidyl-prolyl cis-trans isomerase n=1 Tax=Brevundimonas sp. TaxID=1871086 RepID=UPI002FCBD254
MKHTLTALTLAVSAALACPAAASDYDTAKAAYDAAMVQHESAMAQYRAAQSAWDAGQQAHLAWNAARKGWSTTESGLQYRLVGKANPAGAQPAETDTVMVHYRGNLINGAEFDSSYSRNEPTSFPLNRVIKGWTEGVALMREGETYEFLIPADLAYGARRMGDDIPANSALYFTVELLKVNP